MLTFALRNLMSRPARSFLSLVGLVVAIAGMVGLFSVARGVDEMVNAAFGRIGGLVAMQPGAPIPLFSRLPASWGDEIAHIPGVRVVNAQVWTRANVIDGKTIVSPPRFLFGTDIESRIRLKDAVYSKELIAGRFLRPDDRGTTHSVISRSIAEEFHKGVGDRLQVNGADLTIVGIYHCGSLLLDIAIILDIDEVRRISRFGNEFVSAFYLETTGAVSDEVLTRNIQAAFAGRPLAPWQPSSVRQGLPIAGPIADLLERVAGAFGISASSLSGLAGAPTERPASGDLPPIEVRSASEWAARIKELSGDLDIVLTILSGIGVMIAVLSIVNTMLMSVTERIVEFGVLKANGWSRVDVLRLISSESAILGIAGGFFGSAAGWGATRVLNALWPERLHLFASPGLLLFAVVFSTVLGILGGLYPAIWAMRMMPMDAIRRG